MEHHTSTPQPKNITSLNTQLQSGGNPLISLKNQLLGTLLRPRTDKPLHEIARHAKASAPIKRSRELANLMHLAVLIQSSRARGRAARKVARMTVCTHTHTLRGTREKKKRQRDQIQPPEIERRS